jgi:flagellar basal-body rod protein FlgG
MLNTLNHLWTIASSGIHSRQRHLDLLSHNVANLNTIGFKASQAGFQALIRERTLTEEDAALFIDAEAGDVVQEGMGALFTHSSHLFTQGSLQQTNDPLHLAINGDGFFQVVDPAGRTLYTRSGDFHRDAEGRLVNANGYRLQPDVVIGEDVAEIYIDSAGRIFGRVVGQADVAQIEAVQVAIFPNPDGLENVGSNAFIEAEASGAAIVGIAGIDGRGSLSSGYLEGSNVDLSREMTELLRSQRAYSLSLRSLHVADEIFRRANEMPRP